MSSTTYSNDSVTTFFNNLNLSNRGQASLLINDNLVKNIPDHQFQFGLKNGTTNVFMLKITGSTINVDLTRNI